MTNIWYRDPSGSRCLAQGTDVETGAVNVSYLSPHSAQHPGLVRRYLPAAWVEKIDGPTSPRVERPDPHRAGIDAYYERHRLAGTDSGD